MKSAANLVLALTGAAALGAFGWHTMSHVPRPPAASANQCARQQILAVADVTERAILSARCAQRNTPSSAHLPAPASVSLPAGN